MKLGALFAKLGEQRLSYVKGDGTATTDKTLLSLRRQMRLNEERREKEYLRQELRRRAQNEDRAVFTPPKKRVGERTILSRLPADRSKHFASAKSDIYS